MGVVPVVALGLGPVAGLGAARMAASHYSVLVDGIAQMFVAGPPVVKRIGQDLTKEELGGARIHVRNGAVDDLAASEDEAFAMAKRFLSYLPSSIDELPPRTACDDPTDRADDWLIRAVPKDRRKIYKMRPIVEAVVDRGSFFEIGRHWGRPLITGLARLDGWPVAVAASDPRHYGGAFTANAAAKLTRFADLAQTFHMPVVFLADIPGFLVGKEAEETGTIRQGVRALSAIHQATVPWCSIIIRKVFGVAGGAQIVHNGYRYRYAWPSGDWGSAPGGGRHRGRLQGRDRRSRRPRSPPLGHRGTPEPDALALPNGRGPSPSRTSSTRARPAQSSAPSPTTPPTSAAPAPAISGCGRERSQDEPSTPRSPATWTTRWPRPTCVS